MNREQADRRAQSDSKALLEVPPTPDIADLEDAAYALARHNEIRHAIALWALALRLRMEVTDAP